MNKGQTSIEFLVLLGFMLLVFTAFFVFAEDFLRQNNQAIVKETLITIGEHVVQELAVANQVNNGYQRTFDLPFSAADQPYTVQILRNRELVLNTTNYEHLFFLPFNVTINGADTGYFAPGNGNTITKDASGVYVTTS